MLVSAKRNVLLIYKYIYVNLFLNICFVLIRWFCYYHATVIEKTLYILGWWCILLYSQLKCNTFIWMRFFYFFGVMCWTCWCLCFLIAVLCITFRGIMSVSITWLRNMSIVFNGMLGRLYLLIYLFLLETSSWFLLWSFRIYKFQFVYFSPSRLCYVVTDVSFYSWFVELK